VEGKIWKKKKFMNRKSKNKLTWYLDVDDNFCVICFDDPDERDEKDDSMIFNPEVSLFLFDKAI